MAQPINQLSSGSRTRSPNHHLWNNNGTWWVHYTVHLPDYTKQRVRQSLETKSVEQARLRRDQLIGGPRSIVAAVGATPILPNFNRNIFQNENNFPEL